MNLFLSLISNVLHRHESVTSDRNLSVPPTEDENTDHTKSTIHDEHTVAPSTTIHNEHTIGPSTTNIQIETDPKNKDKTVDIVTIKPHRNTVASQD